MNIKQNLVKTEDQIISFAITNGHKNPSNILNTYQSPWDTDRFLIPSHA